MDKFDYLVAEWFKKSANGIVNEEYLFLQNISSVEYLDKSEMHYKIVSVEDFFDHEMNNVKSKNFILYQNVDSSNKNEFKHKMFPDLQKYKFLFIPNKYKITPAIAMAMIEYIPVGIMDDERFIHYLEKIDPLKIIHLMRQNIDLSPDLIISLMIKVDFLYGFNLSTTSLILNRTSYGLENLAKNIRDDILLLQWNQFLTSRLAVIIYRATTLNITATTTEIGRYFHKCLHQKSQAINYRLLSKLNRFPETVKISDIGDKNFKAYDLFMSPEKIIKTDIAKKLLQHKDKTLDVETIAEVTDLSVYEMEALQNKILMRS